MRADKQRIADLESEIAELQTFNATNRERLARYRAILAAIVVEHQPKSVTAHDGVAVELRCGRCQSDEHHTWANDNYLPWPCPTLAPFLTYAVYKPAVVDPEVASGETV